jgi:hypothetical protein
MYSVKGIYSLTSSVVHSEGMSDIAENTAKLELIQINGSCTFLLVVLW